MADDGDNALPTNLIQFAAFVAAMVTESVLAARVHQDEQLGRIMPAAPGWRIAVYLGDDEIRYYGVVGFIVGASGVRACFAAEPYETTLSALVDPASGRYIDVANSKTYPDKASFLAAMKALRKFLAEGDQQPIGAAN